MNTHYRLKGDDQVDKNSELVAMVKAWVDQQYEDGRVTVMADDELEQVIDQVCAKLEIKLGKQEESQNGEN